MQRYWTFFNLQIKWIKLRVTCLYIKFSEHCAKCKHNIVAVLHLHIRMHEMYIGQWKLFLAIVFKYWYASPIMIFIAIMKRKDMKLWMNRFPLLTSSQKCDTTHYRNQSSVFAESENAFMNIRGDGPRAKTSILALTAMNQFSDDFMYLQYTYGRSVFQSWKHLLLCTPQTLNVQQQTVKITSYGMW